MNSPTTQQHTKTTMTVAMIRAFFLALFLLSTSTIASPTAKSSSKATGNETSNELELECSDDPDFRWKGTKKKTCDWISNLRISKREKYCQKTMVQKNCPVTCQIDCNDTTNSKEQKLKSCPRKLTSPKFQKPCDNYQSNKVCDFDFVYTGCSNGDMACKPRRSYNCFEIDSDIGDGDTQSKRWVQGVTSYYCAPTRPPNPKPYGQACNPNKCPPFAPLPNAPCDWYSPRRRNKSKSTCTYDRDIYTCDKESQKWLVEEAPNSSVIVL